MLVTFAPIALRVTTIATVGYEASLIAYQDSEANA
jgi:hypothetical protein